LSIIRKTLILIHRYLGIVLSLLFLMWFITGIAMIYARGMPVLTPEARLERLPVLDAGKIHLSPAEAFERIGFGGYPDTAELRTILNRPAYVFSGIIIFADDGTLLEMTPEKAHEAARLFVNLPREQLHAAGVLASPDQWTITESDYLPLHKFVVDDEDHTELYVSELTGEVALRTTRASRALAWVAAIPHWLYFEGLRAKARLWRHIVLWSSGLATISALIGLALAVIHYRRRAPHIPYTGWLRWHYITGVIFGVFTVTWVFSGFLSMEPWYWASDGGLGDGMAQALRGGDLDLKKFPVPAPEIAGAKVVEYLTIQGDSYYRIRASNPEPVLISATSMQVRSELFSAESILRRITAPNPEVPVLESKLLEHYDSYYYSFDRRAPLPVLRAKFDDPDSTWLYVDPKMSRLVGRAHRRERLQRWIYHGFHSLDFSFWYYNRPLWDIGVITLSLGGIALSFIGVVIAWKRISRATFRKIRA
jgi:hypothetical protein